MKEESNIVNHEKGKNMKWSKLKEVVQECLDKETIEENIDPEVVCIDISAGMMEINPDIIIHIEDGELEIF